MARNYYPQSDDCPATMTVGQLMAELAKHDPASPVCFRTPFYGVFGSNMAFTIDAVTAEALERREHHTPAGTSYDEETGEECPTEEYTQVFHPWSGVVIG